MREELCKLSKTIHQLKKGFLAFSAFYLKILLKGTIVLLPDLFNNKLFVQLGKFIDKIVWGRE